MIRALLLITSVAMVCGVMGAQAAEPVAYPEDRWGVELLQMIQAGPSILPRDFDTGTLPPPANDSDETARDLEALRAYKAARTPEQVEKILYEHTVPSPVAVFEKEGLYDPQKHPLTQAFIQKTERDVGFFVLRDKKHFARARPSQLAYDLDIVIDNPRHASYPSGHATQSYYIALVLGGLDSANKDKYETLALDIGRRREIAGVHYPSDSEAGRKLAQVLFDTFVTNPQTAPLYEAAKKEFSH